MIEEFVAIDGNDASTLEHTTAWYDSPGQKRFQYFDVVDAMRGFRDAPDLAGLEELATRLQSSALRAAAWNPDRLTEGQK